MVRPRRNRAPVERRPRESSRPPELTEAPGTETARAMRELPLTMRALVKETAGPGAAIRELPVPEPGPGEVLVRVEAASVCGTDLHIERWNSWAEENFGPPPLVFGHEMAGTVVARGEGATSVRIGDLVAAESHIVDWTCYQCRTGRAHVCRQLRILGVHVPGSFAEYAVIPERNAWVTEGLSAEVAALQEPMGNAVHAVFVEEVAGLSVVVLGCGPIGLMAIAIARMAGARHVFATDLNEERLAMAERMGADETIDARTDVAGRLLKLTDGEGVDVVLEMSGSEAALHQGLAAITNGGRISLLGTHAAPITLDVSADVIFKGIRVYGITGRLLFETWYRTTALLEEGLDLSSIITHRMPLSDYARAFDLVAQGHAGKVVLLPQEG
jgi:threonine 3-dehydrogenase